MDWLPKSEQESESQIWKVSQPGLGFKNFGTEVTPATSGVGYSRGEHGWGLKPILAGSGLDWSEKIFVVLNVNILNMYFSRNQILQMC